MSTTLVPRYDGPFVRTLEDFREAAQQWLDEAQGDCDKAGTLDDNAYYQGRVDALTDLLELMVQT